MRTLRINELNWAGGFFAGEGHFTGSRTKNHGTIFARVSQAYDTELLERFWESVGCIGRVRSSELTSGHFGTGPMYMWQTNGFEKVQFIAAVLWPYIGEYKQEQYILALKKWRNCEKRVRHPL